jgi:para-nitrobenzyl esterase
VDGYFFPEQPINLYKSGNVSRIPLLVGWNSGEGGWQGMFGQEKPTKENFEKIVRKTYPDQADELLKVYVVNNDSDVERVASEMAGDRFIAFGTWRWAELQAKTNSPVYRIILQGPGPVFAQKSTKHPCSLKV